MPYSVELLPGEPEQNDPAHRSPLVKFTIYVTAGMFGLAAVVPHRDLPYGLPHDNSHTENKEPSTRVDNVRQTATVSSSAALKIVVSFGKWHTPDSST